MLREGEPLRPELMACPECPGATCRVCEGQGTVPGWLTHMHINNAASVTWLIHGQRIRHRTRCDDAMNPLLGWVALWPQPHPEYGPGVVWWQGYTTGALIADVINQIEPA